MSCLELYIKGDFVISEEIEFPVYSKESTSFETRATLREWYVKSQVLEMKQKYYNALAKYPWEIVLVICR